MATDIDDSELYGIIKAIEDVLHGLNNYKLLENYLVIQCRSTLACSRLLKENLTASKNDRKVFAIHYIGQMSYPSLVIHDTQSLPLHLIILSKNLKII